MVEMVGWHVGNGIEVKMTRKKLWTIKDEKEGTKWEWMHSCSGCNMNKMPLACFAGMVEVLEASFG